MFTNKEILFTFTLIVIMYIAKRYFDSLRSIQDLKLLEIQLSQKIDKGIMDTLDQFIEDMFDEYLLTSPKYVQQIYISNDDEENMRDDLIDIISDRISPYLYQQLAVYCNEESIPDIIANKIYLLTTAYVIQRNSVKQSKEEL